MDLRPHQTRAIDDVRAAFRRHRRVLLVAPTGFGKTAVSAQLIAWAVARGRRVLFLVHRREIVLDTHRRLPGSGLVMAGERVTEAPPEVLHWIDLEDPTVKEASILEEPFHFHPLAIEDCLSDVHHPEVDDYHEFVFLLVRGLRFDVPSE